MAHPRRFRFGVQASTATDGAAWAQLARKAEALGYDSILMPDHFGDQLAPVPALMAAADATDMIKIGTLVFGNDYKHPVVLAKEVATLDVLSGGRVEFGIGAGWMNTDYDQSGIAHDSPKVRIERLAESIAICKAAFGPDPVDHDGRHYQVTGYQAMPKPVQSPHPKFILGGGGRQMLTLAAHEGDIVGINPKLTSGQVDGATAQNGVAARTDEKVAWVRDAAGERYPELELNMLVFMVQITDDAQSVIDMVAPLFGLDGAEVPDYPLAWIGSRSQIVEALQARRERWDVSYLVVGADAMETAAPIVAELAGT